MRSWLNKFIALTLIVTLLAPSPGFFGKEAAAAEEPAPQDEQDACQKVTQIQTELKDAISEYQTSEQSCQDAKTNYSMLTHAVSGYQSQVQNMVGSEAKQLLKEDLAREVAEQKEGAGQGNGGAGAAMQGAVRCKYRAIGQPRCVYTDSWGKGGLLTVTLASDPADAVCRDVEGSVALVKSQAYSAAESEQQFTSVSQQPFQFTVAPELSHMMSRETLSDLNKTETGGWNVRLRVRKPDGSYEERISEDRVTFMEVDPRYKEGPPGTFTANCGGYSPEDLLDVAVQCTYRDQCRGDALAERELGMVTAAGTFTVKVPNPDRECVYGFYETRFVGGAGHSIHSATSGRNALTGTISASAVSKGKTCPECRFAAHCNILPAEARGRGAWVELETGSCPKYCPMQCPKYPQLAMCPDYCQAYCPAYPQLTMCSGYCQAYCPKYEPVSMCTTYPKIFRYDAFARGVSDSTIRNRCVGTRQRQQCRTCVEYATCLRSLRQYLQDLQRFRAGQITLDEFRRKVEEFRTKMSQFNCQTHIAAQLREMGGMESSLLWQRLEDLPNGTVLRPEELGMTDLPPGSQIQIGTQRDRGQDKKGYWITMPTRPGQPHPPQRFMSFDGSVEIIVERNAEGRIIRETRIRRVPGSNQTTVDSVEHIPEEGGRSRPGRVVRTLPGNHVLQLINENNRTTGFQVNPASLQQLQDIQKRLNEARTNRAPANVIAQLEAEKQKLAEEIAKNLVRHVPALQGKDPAKIEQFLSEWISASAGKVNLQMIVDRGGNMITGENIPGRESESPRQQVLKFGQDGNLGLFTPEGNPAFPSIVYEGNGRRRVCRQDRTTISQPGSFTHGQIRTRTYCIPEIRNANGEWVRDTDRAENDISIATSADTSETGQSDMSWALQGISEWWGVRHVLGAGRVGMNLFFGGIQQVMGCQLAMEGMIKNFQNGKWVLQQALEADGVDVQAECRKFKNKQGDTRCTDREINEYLAATIVTGMRAGRHPIYGDCIYRELVNLWREREFINCLQEHAGALGMNPCEIENAIAALRQRNPDVVRHCTDRKNRAITLGDLARFVNTVDVSTGTKAEVAALQSTGWRRYTLLGLGMVGGTAEGMLEALPLMFALSGLAAAGKALTATQVTALQRAGTIISRTAQAGGGAMFAQGAIATGQNVSNLLTAILNGTDADIARALTAIGPDLVQAAHGLKAMRSTPEGRRYLESTLERLKILEDMKKIQDQMQTIREKTITPEMRQQLNALQTQLNGLNGRLTANNADLKAIQDQVMRQRIEQLEREVQEKITKAEQPDCPAQPAPPIFGSDDSGDLFAPPKRRDQGEGPDVFPSRRPGEELIPGGTPPVRHNVTPDSPVTTGRLRPSESIIIDPSDGTARTTISAIPLEGGGVRVQVSTRGPDGTPIVETLRPGETKIIGNSRITLNGDGTIRIESLSPGEVIHFKRPEDAPAGTQPRPQEGPGGPVPPVAEPGTNPRDRLDGIPRREGETPSAVKEGAEGRVFIFDDRVVKIPHQADTPAGQRARQRALTEEANVNHEIGRLAENDPNLRRHLPDPAQDRLYRYDPETRRYVPIENNGRAQGVDAIQRERVKTLDEALNEGLITREQLGRMVDELFRDLTNAGVDFADPHKGNVGVRIDPQTGTPHLVVFDGLDVDPSLRNVPRDQPLPNRVQNQVEKLKQSVSQLPESSTVMSGAVPGPQGGSGRPVPPVRERPNIPVRPGDEFAAEVARGDRNIPEGHLVYLDDAFHDRTGLPPDTGMVTDARRRNGRIVVGEDGQRYIRRESDGRLFRFEEDGRRVIHHTDNMPPMIRETPDGRRLATLYRSLDVTHLTPEQRQRLIEQIQNGGLDSAGLAAMKSRILETIPDLPPAEVDACARSLLRQELQRQGINPDDPVAVFNATGDASIGMNTPITPVMPWTSDPNFAATWFDATNRDRIIIKIEIPADRISTATDPAQVRQDIEQGRFVVQPGERYESEYTSPGPHVPSGDITGIYTVPRGRAPGQPAPAPAPVQVPGQMSRTNLGLRDPPNLTRDPRESRAINEAWIKDNPVVERVLGPEWNLDGVEYIGSGQAGDVFRIKAFKVDNDGNIVNREFAIKMPRTPEAGNLVRNDVEAFETLAGERLPEGVRIPEPRGALIGPDGRTPVGVAMDPVDLASHKTLDEWLASNPSPEARQRISDRLTEFMRLMERRGFGNVDSGPQNFLVNPQTGELTIIDLGSWQRGHTPTKSVPETVEGLMNSARQPVEVGSQ